MIPAVRGNRLASTLAAPRPERRKFRQGVVNAIAAGPPPTLTVTLSGGSVQVVGLRYMASYAPVVGDTVWLEQNGTDLVVMGALGPGPLAAQATNLMATIAQARLVGVVTGAAPTGGPYAVGDYALDTQGRQWLCTAAGSPGTWKPIGTGTWRASAYRAAAGSTIVGGGVFVTDTTQYDDNSNLTGSNTYTAPVAGSYDFAAVLTATSGAAGQRLQLLLYKNGAAYAALDDTTSYTNGEIVAVGGAAQLKLAANDTVNLGYFSNVNGMNFFVGQQYCWYTVAFRA